jgi:uncharacterized RDD family membrane protein YckC
MFLTTPASAEEIAAQYDSGIVVRRWGATWIDFILLGVLAAISLGVPANLRTATLLVVTLCVLAYFPVLEHLFGRTPGKFVCRVRVVDAAGRHPSWGQAIVRTLLRLVEVNPILLGGIPAGIAVLVSRKKQRLGDMAANTFVLKEDDVRVLSAMKRAAPAVPARGATPPIPTFTPPPPPPPPVRHAVPPIPSEMRRHAAGTEWLLPINRSGWAIAAGYLGLLSLLGIFAPFALITGILGLREISRKPGLGGKGRAIFGIVMGGLMTALVLYALLTRR